MVKRYYAGLDAGGASGVACYFVGDTNVSGNAIFQREDKNILGAADAVVTIQVTSYTNSNRSGQVEINPDTDPQSVRLNSVFDITLNSSGQGVFTAEVLGDPADLSTVIGATFSIVGVNIGQIGSPNNSSITKVF